MGSYTIGDELGRGAMGSIFEAVHRVTGVRRAIKVVRTELALSPEYRERFVREASIATQLRHPNIVETYDPIIEGGLLALPMELLHGTLLAAFIQDRTRLDLTEITRLVLPVGRALAAIHARGYVHRDVKPHNVMLVEAGGALVPKLLDFGTARDISGVQRSTLTGEIIGSPAYMAPEQALGLRDIDARADIYAFGVTLYHALSGRRPFVTDAEGSPIEKLIRRAVAKKPSEHASGIAPEVEAVVMRAIAWERAERFADMSALLAAFEGAVRAAEEAVTARGHGGPTTSPMGRIESSEAQPAQRASVPTIQGAAFAPHPHTAAGTATTLPAPGPPQAHALPPAAAPRASLRAEVLQAIPTGAIPMVGLPSPVAARASSTVAVPEAPAPRQSGPFRSRALLAGGVVVGCMLLGLAAALAVVVFGGEGSEPPPPLVERAPPSTSTPSSAASLAMEAPAIEQAPSAPLAERSTPERRRGEGEGRVRARTEERATPTDPDDERAFRIE